MNLVEHHISAMDRPRIEAELATIRAAIANPMIREIVEFRVYRPSPNIEQTTLFCRDYLGKSLEITVPRIELK